MEIGKPALTLGATTRVSAPHLIRPAATFSPERRRSISPKERGWRRRVLFARTVSLQIQRLEGSGVRSATLFGPEKSHPGRSRCRNDSVGTARRIVVRGADQVGNRLQRSRRSTRNGAWVRTVPTFQLAPVGVGFWNLPGRRPALPGIGTGRGGGGSATCDQRSDGRVPA